MSQPSTSGIGRKRKRQLDLNNPRHEVILESWLDEESQDFSDCDDEFVDPDFHLLSEHDTDSEQSEEEAPLNMSQNQSEIQTETSGVGETSSQDSFTNNEPRQGTGKSYYGKNGYKWSSSAPVSRACRSLSHNIVRNIRQRQRECINPATLWSEFIDSEMLEKIVIYTNKKLSFMREKYKETERTELRDTDLVELKALFGLLFYTSVFKSNRENINILFATDGTGREIFRSVLSKNRFLNLLTALRFDDIETRSLRIQEDPLAAISELFGMFIEKCKAAYVPGAYLCVDEMLVPYRGRCKFIMYMPKKPAKYGLKIVLVCDAKTFYVYNAYIYYGKNSDGVGLSDEERKLAIPTQSVLRLCKDFENTHRNITADNWFSSVELMEKLLERGLTYIGTLKKNKRHIPPSFQASKTREPKTSLHGFTKDFTLVSYVPKKYKAVLLISSMHHSAQIDPETNKPEVIIDYNMTKGGVDEVDKKCSNYSCSRRTQRWPMAIFYRILDLSGVNTYVIYKSCTNAPPIERGRFLQSLARELVVPHLNCRVYNTHLPRELTLTIKRILGNNLIPKEQKDHEEVVTNQKRKLCNICPSKLKRKTPHQCIKCKIYICLQCAQKVCQKCALDD